MDAHSALTGKFTRRVTDWRRALRRPSPRTLARALPLYHTWYYETHVWNHVTFLGIKTLKSVSDLWSYQEILWNLKPSLLVEFGTRFGGSALYFQMILSSIARHHRVLTVDVDDTHVNKRLFDNANIELFKCSSTDAMVARRIEELRQEYPGPVFFILDSDHTKDHVLKELLLLRGVTRPGDYVVVEDSNINGHPVRPDFGPGPYEALEAYFKRYPNDYEVDTKRERKFGFTFAVNGFLIRR
jgi:cephalosporin hydroxylase